MISAQGAALPGSVEIVSATAPEFGRAVRAAVLHTRFTRDAAGGVRSLQQTFNFRLAQ
jgi:hypothetical protein